MHVVSGDWLSEHTDIGDAARITAADTSPKSGPACEQEEEICTMSIIECLVLLCRHAGLILPKATQLSLNEQQQALLLCLARNNKEVCSGLLFIFIYDCIHAFLYRLIKLVLFL